MKKMLMITLASTLFLSSCASTTMSLEEVENAISDGILTAEDAFERGLVDEEWFNQYKIEKKNTEIASIKKTDSNVIGDFETTTIGGEIFTSDMLNEITYFAFINPSSKEGKQAFDVLDEHYGSIIENKGDILVINTSGQELDYLLNSKLKIINYNQSMIESLGHLNEMVKTDGFSGSWNVNGSFLSAWSIKIDSKAFVDNMKSIIEMANN